MAGLLSQLIIIDSKDRAAGTSSNFTYNMGSYGPTQVYGYRVNKITIPFSWSTIPAQTFDILYNSVQYVVSIGGGQYNVFQLQAAVQLALNAAVGAGALLIAFNNDGTNSFTISTVNPLNTLVLQFNINNLAAQSYKSVGVAMGFATAENVNTATPTVANSFTSFYAINLTGPPNIYVKSSSLQVYTSSFFNKNPDCVVQSVPVNSPAASYIIWQNSVETNFYQDPISSKTSWDMRLCDEYNNDVLLNGLDWTIEIQVYYKF